MSQVFAVKSESDAWELDVLGVPFGGPNNGRDTDGQYFSAASKLYLDRYAAIPAVYYHGFDPDTGRPASEPQYIGKTTGYEVKADGVWFRVLLDKANSFAQRVWDAAQRGIAKASSGSVAHLHRVGADGHITHWPVAELSIFDAVGSRQPANQYAVALPVMKAVYAQAGIALPDDIEGMDVSDAEAGAEGAQQSAPAAGASEPAHSEQAADTAPQEGAEDVEMDEKQINEMVAQQVAAALKTQQDAAAEAARQEAAVQARIDDALKAQKAQHEADLAAAKSEAAVGRRLPGDGGAPYVAQFGNLSKYDDLDTDDLSVLFGLTSAVKSAAKGNGPSEDLRRALAVRLAEMTGDSEQQYRAAKSAMKMAGVPVKANEINQSTLANYGDDWIGVTYSTLLWDKIRLATPVAARIPTVVVPQGSESVILPLASTAPTFYKVAQAANLAANPGRPTSTVTASQLGTAKQTLTVAKLGAAVNYTGELEEDSLIPWVSELRRDLTNEAAEVLEHIIIDGDTDTTATTNINDIGGTPAGSEAFLLFDGFRKLALITNTANARSAGALAIEDYLETVKLLGLAGKNAADKNAVSFLVDMWTHWKSLELPEVKTRDVFVAPTVENGMLTNVYGYNVIVTPNMHRANQDTTYGLKANTAGKVNLDTASANTTGSILAVRWDQWRLGYKRRMQFEIERDVRSDSTAIVVTMRVGMINRDNEASSISYNVGL